MTVDESPPTERPDRAPRDERWYLTDEREFLQRSLDDADRERDAGDLSVEDHSLLVARDRARLAEVESEIATLDAAAVPTKTMRRPMAVRKVSCHWSTVSHTAAASAGEWGRMALSWEKRLTPSGTQATVARPG